MTLNSLSQLLPQYDEQEARSIVRLMLQDCFGWNYTEICCGVLDSMSAEEASRLASLMNRLEDGEPVQYVTGKVEFYGREFHVEPGVLIPRPETEVLVDLIKSSVPRTYPNILDIGTGSGCIAVTLAKEIEGSIVTAWEISDDALQIARGNATLLGAAVEFVKRDALNASDKSVKAGDAQYDVIVSNPPYICNKEKESMERNVLDYEPDIALFVPDDDPLLFYRSITEYARRALKDGGLLAFEINPLYESELRKLVGDFSDVSIHQDQYGKARCLLAHKKSRAAVQNG